MSPAEAPAAPTNDPSSAAPDYASNSVTNSLMLTPVALMRIVDCVKPERYDERPKGESGDDRFTLREAIAHLADFEVTVLDRITLSQETPGREVPNFDEDARCQEKAYATRDVHHELEVFQNRRRDTVSYLGGLSKEDLRKTFVHPQRGELSAAEYLTVLLAHDVYHLEHATSLMR